MIYTSDFIKLLYVLISTYRFERKTRETTFFLKILFNAGANYSKPSEKIVLVKIWNPFKPFLLKKVENLHTYII